ncbi:DUF4339 domain-containing protein [Dyella amyloliquefaciens]|uniref:DUF4339 domain-containing protein n=1 Tax=Dyella amyloliquefaciens TaxID=1770545 RepID=UPI00102EAD88|nr:DUF4339 domain-containing protein [Dyella amyloliquefaciens]
MSVGEKIWIAEHGERSGPFPVDEVRRWMTEGRYDAQTLAWRNGMPEWAPLYSLFSERPAPAGPLPPSPPPAAAVFDATDRPAATHMLDEPTSAYRAPAEAPDEDLPPAPSMHWGVLLLLGIVTLGIFTLVWPFMQANWVRKIDKDSKAMLWLGIGVVCLVVGEVVSIGHPFSLLGSLLSLAYFVLFITAYFAMAGSIRSKLAPHGLPVEIGGVTLFFFNTFYLQGQLRWIARWQETGARQPEPPKVVFWVLWLAALVLGAALVIPAYQRYVQRIQAMQMEQSE